MTFRLNAARLVALLTLLGWGACAQADTIDPFTHAQGPFTVGPAEEISEDDAIEFTDSVLGGFRVAVPGVGEDSAAGSTATLGISGGQLECTIDFPNVDPVNNNGGCSLGYDRGVDEVFDLTGSSQFEFQVDSVEGGMSLTVTVIDTNQDGSFGVLENVNPGLNIISFDTMFSTVFGPTADFSSVDSIAFVIINKEGEEGSVIVSHFGTDGAITGGPDVPPDGGDDEVLPHEISGNYYSAARDGEGCLLSQEANDITYVITCYFYQEGEQFWLIGVGALANNQMMFDMTITSNASYGDDFDPDDVLRETWGSAIMTWSDCNNITLDLAPVLEGYESIVLTMNRLVPVTCGGDGPTGEAVPWMGSWYDALRDGEGYHLAVEGEGSIYVMTWYTYLDGKQVWLIGVGTLEGDTMTFPEMIITRGADWGSAFDKDDVVRVVFGSMTLTFGDCNNMEVQIRPVLPGFSDLDLSANKIVQGVCP